MGLKIVLENFESADPRQINRVIAMLQCLEASYIVTTGATDVCTGHTPVKAFGSLSSSAAAGMDDEVWTPHVDLMEPIEAFKAPELPVPPAPPVPPPTPISGIEVDADGYPWDGRIHTSSRAKTTDGAWRKRRGVDTALVTQIEGQLKQTMTIPAHEVIPAPAATIGRAVADPFPFPMPTLGAPPPPPPFASNVVLPAGPVSSTPTVSAGAAPAVFPSKKWTEEEVRAIPEFPIAPATFPALMQKITAAFQQESDKSAFQVRIQEAIASVGLPSLPMLASRQDLVAAVATKLGLAL